MTDKKKSAFGSLSIGEKFHYSDQNPYPPGYLAVFLDGYKLNRVPIDRLKRPFDEGFAAAMEELLRILVTSPRYNVRFGFTLSDEIFLLLDPAFTSWGRRPSHFLSILSSEVAVNFDKLAGLGVPWECKVLPCPTAEDAAHFLMTRRARAIWSLVKNQLYYMLRESGLAAEEADNEVRSLSHVGRLNRIAELGDRPFSGAITEFPISFAVYREILGEKKLGLTAIGRSKADAPAFKREFPFDDSGSGLLTKLLQS